MNLILMWSNFGPYHLTRLIATKKLGEIHHCRVRGLELAGEGQYPWHRGKAEKNRITLFPDRAVQRVSAPAYVCRTWQILHKTKPDVLAMAGYDRTAFLTALAWAKIYGKIAILMSDSKADDRPRYKWKEWLKGLLVRRFDAALVGGRPHKEYAISLGIPTERAFVGVDVVDNEHFIRGAASARAREARLRQELGLTAPYFLMVCRFIEEKNLARFLAAYRLYRQMHSQTPWDLVLCGSGPLEATIREAAVDLPGVHFPGFKQADDLPAYYALAQALILASVSETWGLVVNEAMAAGLPVLVSKACGCAPDLIQEGVNGFTFDPYDVEGLARLMAKMSSGEADLKAMGEASQRIISGWTPEVFAKNLFKAVAAAQVAKGAKK